MLLNLFATHSGGHSGWQPVWLSPGGALATPQRAEHRAGQQPSARRQLAESPLAVWLCVCLNEACGNQGSFGG